MTPCTYDVTLIVNGPCGADTTVQQVVVLYTSTADLQDLTSKINVYPNPTAGDFTIRFPRLLLNQTVNVKVIDVLGQAILNIEAVTNVEEFLIDNFEAPNGVYLVEISGENFKATRRINKQ